MNLVQANGASSGQKMPFVRTIRKKELKDNVEVNNIYFLYFSRAG